uniref:BED-type domain-containing protein n=1 Tax=Monopterus albus TaxID=43700 RepID=A0A3Q3Q9S5_MONAL
MSSAVPPGPSLVDKQHSRSAIWNYFAYEANDDGKQKNTSKPLCKSCYRALPTKGANTSNLAKLLKDRHPDLYKEFREVGNCFQCNIRESITKMKPGFKQLLEHLNNRYALPSRNFFMHTEIPALYNETKEIVMNHLGRKPFFSCTTDLWTSRAASTFMAVTLQFITETWNMPSWCLGCTGLNSEHTAECLREASEEMIQDAWKLDMSYMAGSTTDNTSANMKAFQQNFTWVPCFGHTVPCESIRHCNLHLAINKGLDIDRVSGALSRLRKTVSVFSRSPTMLRQLKKKQKDLQVPEHRMIHDEPTRWDSAYQMVERFLEQQQAVCSVLADDWKKWHLMPKDSDITVLETVKEVLSPISSFTDALSGEKHTTLSAVLPLCWKIFSTLTVEEGDSNLKRQLKDNIREDLRQRYEGTQLQLILNTATFLDPRFKDSFVTLRGEVKQNLTVSVNLQEAGSQSQQTSSPDDKQQPAKKTKSDLKRLLTSIQGENSVNMERVHHPEKKMRVQKQNSKMSSQYMKRCLKSVQKRSHLHGGGHMRQLYLTLPSLLRSICASSSSASERVFSTSGLICSARRARLREEHIDMLVFLTDVFSGPLTGREEEGRTGKMHNAVSLAL